MTCGGANAAVDSLGEVEAWLDVHGKGANLPPASQGLDLALEVADPNLKPAFKAPSPWWLRTNAGHRARRPSVIQWR